MKSKADRVSEGGLRTYILHQEAAREITTVWEYLFPRSGRAAQIFREEITSSIERLCRFPYSGHTRTDLTSRPLRFVRVRDYLIAYAPDETPLLVLAVFHGRRDPEALAELLAARH